jgi:hypothetical protein
MIVAKVKPRSDNKFDIYVEDRNGEPLLNSNQGYENVEDAEQIVRRLFGAGGSPVESDLHHRADPVVLTVQYRDGTTKTEQLR